MPAVRVKGLTQDIKGQKVLEGISLEIPKGEFFILTGSSGAGKTALLSILAGIQAYQAGSVEICGYPVGRGKEKHKSYIGMVTQDFSLFNSFTVKENLMVSGMMRGMPSKKINQRINWAVESFQLQEFFCFKLSRLPAGVKQRLALACALFAEPKLLLLDDILFKGDYHSTQLIMKNVFSYLLQGNTCLWATGSPREACALAGGGSGLRELAINFGGFEPGGPEFSPGDGNHAGEDIDGSGWAHHCRPERIGYLNKGMLRIYGAEEFASMAGDMEREAWMVDGF